MLESLSPEMNGGEANSVPIELPTIGARVVDLASGHPLGDVEVGFRGIDDMLSPVSASRAVEAAAGSIVEGDGKVSVANSLVATIVRTGRALRTKISPFDQQVTPLGAEPTSDAEIDTFGPELASEDPNTNFVVRDAGSTDIVPASEEGLVASEILTQNYPPAPPLDGLVQLDLVAKESHIVDALLGREQLGNTAVSEEVVLGLVDDDSPLNEASLEPASSSEHAAEEILDTSDDAERLEHVVSLTLQETVVFEDLVNLPAYAAEQNV